MNVKFTFLLFVALFAQICFAQNATSPDLSSSKAVHKSIEYAEQQLGSILSELHNEEAYLDWLEQIAASPNLLLDDSVRVSFLLENARRNAIGTPAANMEYITLDGETHQLLDGDQDFTLVFFHLPFCSDCRFVEQRLDSCSTMRQMVQDQRLKVIAICPINDEESWRSVTMPDYVVNGWDKAQNLELNDVYVIDLLPVFYLIDRKKNVLLRNEPSLNRILSTITKQQSQN